MPVDAVIPYDEKISEADNAGIAIMDYDSSSIAVAEINKLAERLIKEA